MATYLETKASYVQLLSDISALIATVNQTKLLVSGWRIGIRANVRDGGVNIKIGIADPKGVVKTAHSEIPIDELIAFTAARQMLEDWIAGRRPDLTL